MSEPTGLEWLPEHACGLYLEHNRDRNYYLTVAQALANNGEDDHWVSPEERAKAIATNELWTLQWYPDTPIGFNLLAASSLDALRSAVLQGKADGSWR